VVVGADHVVVTGRSRRTLKRPMNKLIDVLWCIQVKVGWGGRVVEGTISGGAAT
jgi:hypothetical protein